MMDNNSLSKIQKENYDQQSFFQKREVGTFNNITTFVIDQQEEQQIEQRPLQTPNQGQEQSMLSIPEQEEEEEKLYPYYLGQNHYCISKIFFAHLTSYCLFLKRNILDKNEKICDKHLPKLSASENIKQTIEQSLQKLKRIPQLHIYDLVKLVFFGELKFLSFISCLSYCFETIAKNGISVIMSLLITSVSQQDMNSAYKYAIGYILLSLIGIIFKHHGSNFSMVFSSKARMLLVNLVFIKLTELSSSSIKEANIGKILNLISGDINQLEQILYMIFQSSVIFLSVGIGCYILWIRFNGAIGILVLAIVFLAYPIQISLQSFNSETLKQSKQFQDKRLKLTNELVEGIRLIKMYAWEEAFYQMISIIRKNEFKCLLKIAIRSSIDRLFTIISQIWSSLIFFIILHYSGYRESMNVAEMISTLQLLSFFKISCVLMVSYAIQSVILVKISFERIVNILNIKNREMEKVKDDQNINNNLQTNTNSFNSRIQFIDFDGYWTNPEIIDSKPILKKISLNFQDGELWAIVGKVGSGKSSLLNALLFEMPFYKGQFILDGIEAQKGKLSIAYVEQEPYVFPGTVRNNILFGRPFNKLLYQRVIHASQLEQDLLQMKSHDQTEIGERGTTLSGGQKARLSFARALYQQADLYLLDDPLSAVDAHVARNMFQTGIKEFIFEYQVMMNTNKNKPIVILVTHQIQYAVECDKIAVMQNGEIQMSGTFEELQTKLDTNNNDIAGQLCQSPSPKQKQFKRSIISHRSRIRNAKINSLIVKEADSQRLTNLNTYIKYFNYWKLIIFILILSLETGSEVLIIFYSRIISLFQYYQEHNSIDQAYLLLGLLTLGLLICNSMKYILNSFQVQNTTQEIHNNMLNSLIKAPVSYFDVNPSGRIINRFSNDLSLCDYSTNTVILDVLEIIGYFCFALVTLAILQPFFLIMIVFIILVDCYQYNFLKKIISQLKELELMQRSPLFDFLKQTLSGITQVRAYDQKEWFRNQFLDISNKCNLNSLTYQYATRCFGFNLDIVGWIAQTVGIFLFLYFYDNDIAILAQGILMLTTYNDGLQYGLRQLINLETQMSSYNRMFQVIEIKPEAPHQTKQDELYPDFPRNGDVTFENIHMQYRDNCPYVLQGLTFNIKSGEKIGCVGRTGAGKSSILQAIFRMIEIDQSYDSKLEIANIDIQILGLHKLRSSIGIIPQSPFLFSGTIRQNLDPLRQFSDDELWKSLEDANLINYIITLPKGLDSDIDNVNSVFSVGQKQLICLARIILSQKKIIVLDEATANVDMQTDEFIQNVIKRKFKNSTLITIAHRLNTIADYDKVMVMSDGKVIEFDSPFNLLALSNESTSIDKRTEFSRLVVNTGDENAQQIFDIAKQSHIMD
ncbi:unnamed protein product [Paramecium primaurelia]|uniref:ABC transporter family protein n=1 Tax=Paramecium primaurelia TaxID=5886 RepID=A0A8S1NYG3_PARPR|nr:unnamed protein product [Paramecium primaurelia]